MNSFWIKKLNFLAYFWWRVVSSRTLYRNIMMSQETHLSLVKTKIISPSHRLKVHHLKLKPDSNQSQIYVMVWSGGVPWMSRVTNCYTGMYQPFNPKIYRRLPLIAEMSLQTNSQLYRSTIGTTFNQTKLSVIIIIFIFMYISHIT